jgi:hypothetical protein
MTDLPTDYEDGQTIFASHINTIGEAVNDLADAVAAIPLSGEPLLVAGTVNTEADLDDVTSPQLGDVWVVEETGDGFQWNGLSWTRFGQFRGPAVASRVRPPHLLDWFDVLAEAATTPVTIVVIGDSTSGSALYGTQVEELWPYQLQAMLAAAVPSQPATVGSRYAGGDAASPNITTTDGTDTTATSGGWGKILAPGDAVTLVGKMDRVAIEYRKVSGGGTLTIRDGGPSGTILGTVNTAGTAKSGQVWTSDPLTYGEHTIHIAATTADCYLGIVNGMAGNVHLWNCAHGGYTSANYSGTPGLALDLIETIDPDLVIIATGTNDDPANYESRITTLVQAVKAKTTGSVALLVPMVAAGIFGGSFTDDEAIVGRQVAADEEVGLIDLAGTLGEYATNGAGLSLDGLHQNPKGHLAWASVAEAVLSGDPESSFVSRVAAGPYVGPKSWQGAPGDVISAPRGDQLALEDDFMIGDPATSGSIGALRWTKVGAGATANPGSVTHLGIVRLTSGSSGDYTAITLPGGASPVVGDAVLTWWVMEGDANGVISLGLAAGTSSGPSTGGWIERKADGTYDWVVKFAGFELSRTAISGVSGGTNTWHKWQIRDGYVLHDDELVLASANVELNLNTPPWASVGSASVSGRIIVVDRFQLSISGIDR